MELFDLVIKAVFFGITSAGIPMSVIIYCIWVSLKNGKSVTSSILFGNFFVLSFLFIITFLNLEYIFMSALIQITISLLCLLINFIFALTFIAKHKKNITNEEDNDSMTDIYSTNEEYENKRIKKFRFKALISSLVLFATSLNFINFILVSVPAMNLQFQYGTNDKILNTIFGEIIFLLSFLLGEFILILIISKISAFVSKWINKNVFKIISFICACIFIILCIPVTVNIINNIKYI